MNNLTIALIDDTDLSKPGKGQQTRTFELYSRISKYFDIKLFLQKLSNPSMLSWASEINVIKSLPGKLSTWIGNIDSLQKIISKIGEADIIIAEHIYGINRWAPIASKIKNIPYIYDSHGNEIEVCESDIKCLASILPFERYMYKNADLIFAISEEVSNNASKFYGIKKEKFEVLLPGIRKINCKGKSQDIINKLKLWGVNNNNVIAITHGSLNYKPNLDSLKTLLSLSKGAKKTYNVVFVVAGKSNIMKPGWLSDSVLYIGFINNIDELLCSADVALSLNVSGTGIHMKVLDYLSAGLPLIATPKSIAGIPKNSLKGYPLIVIEPNNFINLGELVINLTSKFNGPQSGKAILPTWDEQAELFVRKLNSFLF
jgi:glycosyltransferase involved in cell wall biosynthesis